MTTIDEKVDAITRTTEETRATVLDLQRFLKAQELGLFVRSCTSCLQDSCSRQLTARQAE